MILVPVRKAGALEVGQDAGDDCVDGAEARHRRPRPVRGAERREDRGDDYLDPEAGVDQPVKDAVAAPRGALGADYAAVDADVGGRAGGVAEAEGGDGVDSGQGAEDEELVVDWDEGGDVGDVERGTTLRVVPDHGRALGVTLLLTVMR